MKSNRRGFTVIELLMVIANIAVLIVLLLPAAQQSREAARQKSCETNLKHLGLAMHNYHDAHGLYPPGMVDDDHNATGAMHTGFLLLAPFLEEVAVFNSYNFRVGQPPASGAAKRNTNPPNRDSANWFHLANSTTISKQLAHFYCPSNRNEGVVELGNPRTLAGATDYAMCNGAIPILCGSPLELSYPVFLGGYFGVNSKTRVKDARDGTSLTFAMGEVAGGEHIKGTMNTWTYQPPDIAEIGPNGPDPRPWGIDQGWAVARIDQSIAGGFPRGSIFIAANQHVGADLRIDGDRMTELPAMMNPRFVMVSVVDTIRAGTAAAPDGSSGPCNSGTFHDRLSNARSRHQGGCFFLMGDGRVRFVSENVDRRIYSYLFTIQGKEIVDEDDF
jgi:type II secretory pathway pseudopilin PulG